MKATHSDVLIVGAGIVGIAHAIEALERGYTVRVLDAASASHGASVQNFGHACVTAQGGTAAQYAQKGRARWLDLAARTGLWVRESGTLVAARSPLEMQVLREYAGANSVQILGPAEIRDRAGVNDSRLIGGAYLPLDLQIDPREALSSLINWVNTRGGQLHFNTSVRHISPATESTPRHARVASNRGDFTASSVIVATNAAIGELYPLESDEHQVQRCRLHMLRVRFPGSEQISAPVFTGWSLQRYHGFAAMPSSAALAIELQTENPEGHQYDLHLMATPQRDGSLLLGDTHETAPDASVFQAEAGFQLLLREASKLFGTREISVLERWQGVYAKSSRGEFLISNPAPGVHLRIVTTGIGMTTAHGLAELEFPDPLPPLNQTIDQEQHVSLTV